MSSPPAPHLEDNPILDTAFKALNDPIRRGILEAVRSRNPRSVESFVPAHEDGHTVELQLQHTHLPYLDDTGLIDWNREEGTVVRGPAFDDIEPLLRVLATHQDELPGSWP